MLSSRAGYYRSSKTCKPEPAIAPTEVVAQSQNTDKKCSSDAEAGVLADYVAALVTVDDTDANVQRTLVESLEDFLGRESKRMRKPWHAS
ncbi:hypothetical protein IG631_13897 [Alternaria alternata]|jgi:hypothetical protein|nr:hypothetical protein IG631_13897 [Alternaria alternata]